MKRKKAEICLAVGDLMRLAEAATDTSLGQRIYVVVAETVQTPMGLDLEGGGERLFRPPESVTVRQPHGRVAAQVAHVVSLVRLGMAQHTMMGSGLTKLPSSTDLYEYLTRVWLRLSVPITTVVLSARDSYELHHVYRLLEQVPRARVQAFYDENAEAYGPGKIMTAIATEPVVPSATAGILDYLPLWTPREK
jgi:hypothetical protein